MQILKRAWFTRAPVPTGVDYVVCRVYISITLRQLRPVDFTHISICSLPAGLYLVVREFGIGLFINEWYSRDTTTVVSCKTISRLIPGRILDNSGGFLELDNPMLLIPLKF